MRAYPQNALAAQVLGTVGPFTARDGGDHGVAPTAAVGQSGLEGYYNSVLRSGDTLKTTLDAALQRVGQRALQHAIDANYPATGGAFVALDPENGQVYAMGSLPTYNANVFSRPIPTTVRRRLFSPSSGDPLVDRRDPRAKPDRINGRPDHRARGTRERRVERRRHLRRHRPVLLPGTVPAQLGTRGRRRA